MNDRNILDRPACYAALEEKSAEIGFTMPSDLYIGTLLKTLVTSKPNANLLELGTGMSLSLAWMIDGMDATSHVTSIDNDQQLTAIAEAFFRDDERVTIVCTDGGEWLKAYQGAKFDLVFADAWPGKYYELEETLDLINVGGFYVIDDMRPHTDWPEGHQEKADKLVAYLEARSDFTLTKMDWSTGIIVAVRNRI